MRLSGLHAVITGAGSGLGAAAAVRFAAEGAQVVVSDLDPVGAERVAERIRETSGGAWAVKCDVTDPDQCRGLVDQAERAFGVAIDVFLANAGVSFSGDYLALEPSAIQGTVAVNLTGAAFSAQAALRSLVNSPDPCLLFTASLQGLIGRPRRSIYTATKHAVVGLVKSLALEFGPRGVRVNAIAPGAIDTPLLRRQIAGVEDDVSSAVAAMAGRIPLRRMATEADFANAALFLASREAGAITGQTVVVDCGVQAGPS